MRLQRKIPLCQFIWQNSQRLWKKKIFERFYREEQSRNRETGGNGLGLSIASMIVTAHNGTIRASHNSPKGTIFTIRLPK